MNFKIENNRIFQEDETGQVIAEITFPETSHGVFVIDHTFVDSSLRGQGIASKLVHVKATCSYAAKWLSEHTG